MIPTNSFNHSSGELLGSGAFGVVFTATLQHRTTENVETEVAIKQLKHADAFDSEYQILSELQGHPNLLRLYGCSVTSNARFPIAILVEKCCPIHWQQQYTNSPTGSGNNSSLVMLDKVTVLRYALELADAMAFCHSRRYTVLLVRGSLV